RPVDYKYNKRAGALNEAAAPAARGSTQLAQENLFDGDDYAAAHNTNIISLSALRAAEAPVHAQTRDARGPAPPPPRADSGVDPIRQAHGGGMFYYTVQDGQRVRVIEQDGKVWIAKG